eukprot:8306650-Pyramimonas_sp.AAC.1
MGGRRGGRGVGELRGERGHGRISPRPLIRVLATHNATGPVVTRMPLANPRAARGSRGDAAR